MKFTIEHLRGMWKAELDGRCEFGYSLEDLLQKLDPHAPVEYIAHTAEILSGILGVEYLPVLEWMGALQMPAHSEYDVSCNDYGTTEPDEYPRGV